MRLASAVTFLIPFLVALISGYTLSGNRWQIGWGIVVSSLLSLTVPAFWFADYYALAKGIPRTTADSIELFGLFFGVSCIFFFMGCVLGVFSRMVWKAVIRM